MDINGSEKLTEQIGSGTVVSDLSLLDNGIYFAKVSAAGKVSVSYKFIVQH